MLFFQIFTLSSAFLLFNTVNGQNFGPPAAALQPTSTDIGNKQHQMMDTPPPDPYWGVYPRQPVFTVEPKQGLIARIFNYFKKIILSLIPAPILLLLGLE